MPVGRTLSDIPQVSMAALRADEDGSRARELVRVSDEVGFFVLASMTGSRRAVTTQDLV